MLACVCSVEIMVCLGDDDQSDIVEDEGGLVYFPAEVSSGSVFGDISCASGDSSATRSSVGEHHYFLHAPSIHVNNYIDVQASMQELEAWFVSREQHEATDDGEEKGNGGDEKDNDGEDKNKRLVALRAFAHNVSSNHTVHFGFAKPPEFPFTIRFDPKKCILAMSWANILCIDIDEKDGMSKHQAAQWLSSQADRRKLKFRLYETDHGIHAYCTSRRFFFKDREAWSLMADLECDEYYIAFCAVNGFSVRLSPKTFPSAMEEVDRRHAIPKAQFDSQFVKRPWTPQPVVGKGKENLALVAVVDMTGRLSEFIRCMPSLYERVNSNLEVQVLLRAVTHQAVELFREAQLRFPKDFQEWLQEETTYNVPYINCVTEWTECRSGSMQTKHPLDGRLITVYQRKGMWYHVYKKEYSAPFCSKADAQQDVRIKYGGFQPPNVQSKVPAMTTTGLSTTAGTSSSIGGDKPVKQWRPSEVSRWVSLLFGESAYATKYSEKFAELAIDGDMLLNSLTDEDLENDLGITLRLHRDKILRKRRELLAELA